MFRFEVVDLMEWPKFSYQVKVEEENEELRDVYTRRPGEEKERKQKTTDRGNYSQVFRVFPDLARHYLNFFPPPLARVFVFCPVLELEKKPAKSFKG